MKKITPPKTKYQDYVNCREMILVNYNSLRKIGYSEDEIKKEVDFLYKRFFEKKIFKEDFYSFNNLKDLENFLLKSKYFSIEQIKESINHEKEHLKKIYEFKIPVKGFYVALLNHKKEITFAVGVAIHGEGVSSDKFREIALAPKKLSLTDRLFI